MTALKLTNSDATFTTFLKAVRTGNPALIQKAGGRYVAVEKVNNELSGASGGYLAPVEFTDRLLKPLSETGIVYPRALVVKMGSQTARGPMLDSTTVQAAGTTPFFGGLLFKFGATSTFTTDESEPSFRELSLTAWDLLGYGVISNQMLQDMTPEGEERLIDLIGQAAAWYAENSFFNGLGAGTSMPLGMLNAPCAIDVTRNGAGVIAQVDVAKMAAKLLPMSWTNAVWACSPSSLEKIVQMTGYQTAPGRHDEGDAFFGYLLNRKLFVTDKLPALGTRGDLVLFDPSLYVIGDRQEVLVDVVDDEPTQFQKNRSMYRVWLRLDGKPMLNNKVTLQDAASSTVSSIVVLA